MNTFRGRSLLWLRVLLDQPARYTSARQAMEDIGQYWSEGFDPPLGSVLFYNTSPWGDVGLAVGDGYVLRYEGGRPRLQHLSTQPPSAWAPSLDHQDHQDHQQGHQQDHQQGQHGEEQDGQSGQTSLGAARGVSARADQEGRLRPAAGHQDGGGQRPAAQ